MSKYGSAFLHWGPDGTVDNMKKGGKVKGKKSKTLAMSQKVSQNVKVNVKIGDSVLLRKGNAPRRSNPGVAKRFSSQGSAFGGGLPAPLQGMSYASAPQVTMPLSRMDFIGASDSHYNLNRNKRDDIQVPVNPSGIRADITPSMRAVQNTNAVATPDTGLATARALQKSYDALDSGSRRIYDMMQFEGEVPRIGGANLQPSSRVTASEPSSGWAEMSRYKPQEYVPPPASLAGASASSSSASRNQPGRDRPFVTTLSRKPQAERENYTPQQLYGPPQRKREPPVDPQSLRRGGSVF
jgi:hypothetical protein